MELVPPKLPKKFLGFQVTPASGCFGSFLPLQNGILMIAMIDILAGIIFESVKLFFAATVYLLTGYLGAIPADISACSPLFAIVGIFGIRNLDTEKLHFYSLFKQIEFVVRSVNLIVMGLSLTPIIFLLFIAYCAYSGYCAYIVWSTYELVKSEEGMLVKHGQSPPSQVFRRVLLSYASHFFTNVEVENLSLWSGTVAIENVDVNAKEVTAFLGLPGVQVISGTLGRIEMQVPWAALTSSSLEVSLKEVSLELELGKFHPEPREMEPTPEAEESLVRKILANVKVKVERLSVVLRFKGEAQYCVKLIVSQTNFGTTDRDWEYQFVNPFSLTEGGTAYRHFRLLQVQDLEVRAISGAREDFLSNTVLGHRFESGECKSCALCYAFKSSSFYTLLSLKPCSLDLYWYVSSEKTQLLKPGLLSYVSTTETSSMDLRLTTPVQAKCCLMEESRLVKDYALLIASLSPEQTSKPSSPLLTESSKDDQSWLTWGKDILFPIYFATPLKQQNKMVRVATSFLSISLPQVQWQMKLFNPASLELSRVKLFATELTYKQSSRRTETTDPDYAPLENKDETEGGSRELLMYIYLKNNYSVVRMACLRYALKDTDVIFSGSDADVQVSVKGKTSKAIASKLIEGKITCGTEVTIHTNLEQLHLSFTPDEIIAYIDAMMELNLLYQRFCACADQPFPTLEPLLSHRLPHTSTEDQLAQAELSIVQLKSSLMDAHAQLAAAREEANRLRAVLSNTVGSSVTALAGMLSIDQSAVRAVCVEAVYNTFPAKAVLTASDLIILSQEGRQMNRIGIKSMVRLEERGDEELQVHTDDQASVRMTLR